MRYKLAEVERFPKPLEAGVLYWSKEFGVSAHLCACGCGDAIKLPIGPLDFSIRDGPGGPTLRPSVGNWNVCDAHYFITDGEVEWAAKLSPAQIASARAAEDARREAHYSSPRPSILGRLLSWVMRLLTGDRQR